jgi:hypothetical protein
MTPAKNAFDLGDDRKGKHQIEGSAEEAVKDVAAWPATAQDAPDQNTRV